MRESAQKFHNDTLSIFNSVMYETLIHNFNIITESLKSFIFEDEDGQEIIDPVTDKPLRGYLAMKETNGKKEKYFIEDKFYEFMPLRAKVTEELFLKESSSKKSIILRPINPTPFRIKAENTFSSFRQFVDEFADFEHTNPEEWTLLKLCAIMGYVGKTFLGICSASEFGKSSIFEIMHSLTKKSPVFQPRSVPGILIQITGDGNMVFDEVHQSNAEVKRCMENFILQVAGNKPVYINGAMKSGSTKSKYDVSQQSITALYNLKSYYDKEEDFFDNMFSNNNAIDSRLLKLKFDGKLLEKFDRDFDIVAVAEQNKMYYIRIAKYLLYLKQVKLSNSYPRRFLINDSPMFKLKGRRKQIYNELTFAIDLYCDNEAEYIKFISLLDRCIMDYSEMAKPNSVIEGGFKVLDKNFQEKTIVEEVN